jgi:2-polyprenyl-6-methoxyphenol hydroxylase-like FAD-dependent oxidoreductase
VSTPASPPVHDTDVLIAGGGPVGTGLAIELGQRGVACTLVERHLEPQRIPKGQNLTQRTMEHVHAWGAERELRAARTIPPEFGIGGLTAYGTLLGPHVYDWLQRDLVQAYYHRRNERLPQYATEAVLRARVAELPSVTTLHGWEVEALAPAADAATVGIASRATGERRTLRARYAVGCDGARSVVRTQAGIPQTRSDHDRLMVLLVFRSHGLHALLERYPGKSYFNVLDPQLEGYWKFFGRVDLGATWFFHAPVPPGTTRDNVDFRAMLHDAVGAPFDVAFEHIGFWDLRFAVADRYREGRVFVAGDAAHSHPPYGGYGINAGFEDARNLGWKLAAVLGGWGGDALLDSYGGERRAVFASTATDFIARSIEVDRAFLAAHAPDRDAAAFEEAWRARAAGAVGEVHAFEPHYEGSTVVAGGGDGSGPGGSAVGRHDFAARAGHHLAPAPLSGGRDVHGALGTGFGLLAFGVGAGEVARWRGAAAALGVPFDVVEDAWEGEVRRYGHRLVLVRPDGFVAWAGEPDGTADPTRLLARATGRDGAAGARP